MSIFINTTVVNYKGEYPEPICLNVDLISRVYQSIGHRTVGRHQISLNEYEDIKEEYELTRIIFSEGPGEYAIYIDAPYKEFVELLNKLVGVVSL